MPSSGEVKARQNKRNNRISTARLAIQLARRRIAVHEGRLHQNYMPVLTEVVASSGMPAASTAAGSSVADRLVVARLVGSADWPHAPNEGLELERLSEALNDEAGVMAVDAALGGSLSAWEGVQTVFESWSTAERVEPAGAAAAEAAESAEAAGGAEAAPSFAAEAAPSAAGPSVSLRSLRAVGTESVEGSGTDTSGTSASESEGDSDASSDDGSNGVATRKATWAQSRGKAAASSVRCLLRVLEVRHEDAPPLDPRIRALLLSRCYAWLHATDEGRAPGRAAALWEDEDEAPPPLPIEDFHECMPPRHGSAGRDRHVERSGGLTVTSRALKCLARGASVWRCLLLLLARVRAADFHAVADDYMHADRARARCVASSNTICGVPGCGPLSTLIMLDSELRRLANASHMSTKRQLTATAGHHTTGETVDAISLTTDTQAALPPGGGLVDDGTLHSNMRVIHATLAGGWPLNLEAELIVSTNLTLIAENWDGWSPSVEPSCIESAPQQRVMRVMAGAHVTLCGLGIHGGRSVSRVAHGGAFHVAPGASLSLVDSDVSGFGSTLSGGAVHVASGGQLVLVNSSLRANNASVDGGAISLDRRAWAHLYDGLLHGNTAARAGGAIYSRGGGVALARSTIRHNHAWSCGAVCVRATPAYAATLTKALLVISLCHFTENAMGLVGGAIGIASDDASGNAPADTGAEAPGPGGAADGDPAAWLAWAAACRVAHFDDTQPPVASIVSSSFDGQPSPAVLTSYPLAWRCPLGTTTPRLGAFGRAFAPCAGTCGAGKFGILPTADVPGVPRGCAMCPSGHYCPEDATAAPQPCPGGTYLPHTGAASRDHCQRCMNGTVNAIAGSANCTTVCAAGLASNVNRTACVAFSTSESELPPPLGWRQLVLIGSCVIPAVLLMAALAALALVRRRVNALYTEGLHGRLVELDGAQPPHAAHNGPSRELLCMMCSPRQMPLRKSRAEIVEVADACQWGAERVTLAWGGRADTLLSELRQRPTRRLLFAGHTDAGSGKLALGFTSPGGGLETLDASEFVELLSPYFPRPHAAVGHDVNHAVVCPESHAHSVLELIVLNGCCSEGLGSRLRECGAPCVVCWRTAVRDDAARLFSVSFFRSLAALTAAAEAPLEEEAGARHRATVLCVRAFDEAVRSVCTTTRRSRRGVRKFKLADPGATRERGSPRYPLAAGEPSKPSSPLRPSKPSTMVNPLSPLSPLSPPRPL